MLRNVTPENTGAVAANLTRALGGKLRAVFQHAATGFSVQMSDAQAAALARHPLVDFVEEVALIHDSSERTLPSDNSLWNLDRIDQATPSFDHKYQFCEKGGGARRRT